MRQLAQSERILAKQVGIGLRLEHLKEILQSKPELGWVEIHGENYFNSGLLQQYLAQINQLYPISMHCVSLSLGSSDPLDQKHLNQLKQFISQIQPIFISDHLSWSSVEHEYMHDLLPLPYTEESLRHVANRINFVQDFFSQPILIENISAYLQFYHSTIPEHEFLAELVHLTGCGILLDINNLYVNSRNLNWNIDHYLAGLPHQAIKEIHLAGFTINHCGDNAVLIDSHNQPVAEAVWQWYDRINAQFGPIPTLIEWDSDLPTLDTLLAEMNKAEKYLESGHACAT